MAQHSIDIDINLNDILKNTDKRIKGYAFDSLVFRYKMAREAQADFEFAKA